MRVGASGGDRPLNEDGGSRGRSPYRKGGGYIHNSEYHLPQGMASSGQLTFPLGLAIKLSSMHSPSEALNGTDGLDLFATRDGADLEQGWDQLGEVNGLGPYAEKGLWGPVAYRYSEKAGARKDSWLSRPCFTGRSC